MANYLKDFHNIGEYQKSVLVIDKVLKQNDYSTFGIKLTFANLEEEIEFKVFLANNKKMTPLVMYGVEVSKEQE